MKVVVRIFCPLFPHLSCTHFSQKKNEKMKTAVSFSNVILVCQRQANYYTCRQKHQLMPRVQQGSATDFC